MLKPARSQALESAIMRSESLYLPSTQRSRASADRSSLLPWLVAAIALSIVAGAFLLGSRRTASNPHTLQPPDPHAADIVFTDLAMSESASLSGAKVTYLDGIVRNAGSHTVIGASLQVIFANDMQEPPQIEQVELTLIRSREPEIDTQPVSADPLTPGSQREFRLAFEGISANWNQQMPTLQPVRVTEK